MYRDTALWERHSGDSSSDLHNLKLYADSRHETVVLLKQLRETVLGRLYKQWSSIRRFGDTFREIFVRNGRYQIHHEILFSLLEGIGVWG